MSTRWNSMEKLEKILLIFLAALIPIFAVIYAVVLRIPGVEYQSKFHVLRERDGVTTYSARVEGEPSVFTIAENGVMTYQWADRTYGPWTIVDAPDAAPEEGMKGIEIYEGEERVFRGGCWLDAYGGTWLKLIREDGTPYQSSVFQIFYTVSGGDTYDADGNLVDTREPSLEWVVCMALTPEIIYRGSWQIYFLAIGVSLLAALDIWFAPEQFEMRMNRLLRRNPGVEPSDEYLLAQKIEWVGFTVMALVIYVMGLMLFL